MNSKATYLKPATYVELISTPLVGKVRHQIMRANFDGGCRVSKQECFILHSFQSVQIIKISLKGQRNHTISRDPVGIIHPIYLYLN